MIANTQEFHASDLISKTVFQPQTPVCPEYNTRAESERVLSAYLLNSTYNSLAFTPR